MTKIVAPFNPRLHVRSKRDAEALVRLLNSIDPRYSAQVAYDYEACRWGVNHNLPEWAVNEARAKAYKRGAMCQGQYIARLAGQ